MGRTLERSQRKKRPKRFFFSSLIEVAWCSSYHSVPLILLSLQEKDPNAPKRPKNAFMLFMDENRSKLKVISHDSHELSQRHAMICVNALVIVNKNLIFSGSYSGGECRIDSTRAHQESRRGVCSLASRSYSPSLAVSDLLLGAWIMKCLSLANLCECRSGSRCQRPTRPRWKSKKTVSRYDLESQNLMWPVACSLWQLEWSTLPYSLCRISTRQTLRTMRRHDPANQNHPRRHRPRRQRSRRLYRRHPPPLHPNWSNLPCRW